MPNLKKYRLRLFLDDLVRQYTTKYLPLDPLGIVTQYSSPEDCEIVGFISAMFALGRTELIQKITEETLDRMGNSPYQFITDFNPQKDKHIFQDLVYRFYQGADIGLLIWWSAQIIKKWGSIKRCFLAGYGPDDIHTGFAISRFIGEIRRLKTQPFYETLPGRGKGARHFLTDPADGGGCKRFNLFLRWMVRQDGIDLGFWPEIPTNKLIIPLDTHIARLGRCLGLTNRKSPDWKMAEEITESLKRFDPDDPVKYDFALCTIGKLNRCPDYPNGIVCASCPIVSFCIRVNETCVLEKSRGCL